MATTTSPWIETRKGTVVATKARLFKPKSIVIDGKTIIKPGAVLRGDLAAINIGRYCRLENDVVLRPPFLNVQNKWLFVEVTVGDYVTVGARSVVEACIIGKAVRVGEDCVIGRGCWLRDSCVVKAGTVLPPGTVVPAFSVVAGCPGRVVGELSNTAAASIEAAAVDAFHTFSKDTGDEARSL